MPNARQNLPHLSITAENTSILLVSPDANDESVLREMLPAGYSSNFARCANLAQAMRRIRENRPGVVICECDLPDGCWKAVLEACQALPQPSVVLVTSRHADDTLWADVLNVGGYDVLLKPFDRIEVVRVVTACCRKFTASIARQTAVPELGSASSTSQYA